MTESRSEQIKTLTRLIKVLDCEILRFTWFDPMIEDTKKRLKMKPKGEEVDFDRYIAYLRGKYGEKHPEVADPWIANNILREAKRELEAEDSGEHPQVESSNETTN